MFAIFNSHKWYWHSSSRSFCPDSFFFSSFAEVEMEIKMAKRQDFTADILSFDDGISTDEAIKYINNVEITKDELDVLKEIHNLMGINNGTQN